MAIGKGHEASLETTMSDDEESEDNDKCDDNSSDGYDDGDEIGFSQGHCGALSCSIYLCK